MPLPKAITKYIEKKNDIKCLISSVNSNVNEMLEINGSIEFYQYQTKGNKDQDVGQKNIGNISKYSYMNAEIPELDLVIIDDIPKRLHGNIWGRVSINGMLMTLDNSIIRKKHRWIIISGCYRGATTYIQRVMKQVQVNIGHQGYGDEGIVSGAMATCYHIKGSQVVHQIRDPLVNIMSLQPTMPNLISKWKECPLHGTKDSNLLLSMKFWLWVHSQAIMRNLWTYRIEDIESQWDNICERLQIDGEFPNNIPTNVNTGKTNNNVIIPDVSWDILFHEDECIANMIWSIAKQYDYIDMPIKSQIKPESQIKPNDIDIVEKPVPDTNNHLIVDFQQIASIALHGLQAKELEAVYNTATELSPKVLVEIGAGSGVSSVLLATIAREYKGRLYTIEPYIHQPAWQNWIYNLSNFDLMKYVTLVSVFSPYMDWTNLPFDIIDYLLIDGNHDGIAVLADFFTWSRYIPIGGRIAFHDCIRNPNITKGIEMILASMSYKKISQINSSTGLYVIEKTGKTHGGEGGDPATWGKVIGNKSQYNLTVTFEPAIQPNSIGNILKILGAASINDISTDKIPTSVHRRQGYCYLEKFDLTISAIVDQTKCVIVLSVSNNHDKLVSFIISLIEKVIKRNVTHTIIPIKVI